MAVTLPAGCTRERVEKRIGQMAVDLRIDDDLDSLTDAFEDAWVEVLGYCSQLYSDDALGSSDWILMRWTDIAIFYLCERRLNPGPGAAKRRFDKAIADLEKVQTGAMTIFDAAQRKECAPVLSNQSVRLSPYPHVVTARQQSTGNPETYDTNDDPLDYNPNG